MISALEIYGACFDKCKGIVLEFDGEVDPLKLEWLKRGDLTWEFAGNDVPPEECDFYVHYNFEIRKAIREGEVPTYDGGEERVFDDLEALQQFLIRNTVAMTHEDA